MQVSLDPPVEGCFRKAEMVLCGSGSRTETPSPLRIGATSVGWGLVRLTVLSYRGEHDEHEREVHAKKIESTPPETVNLLGDGSGLYSLDFPTESAKD